MKVLSWDIGIKNLSYCLLSNKTDEENNKTDEENNKIVNYANTVEILDWDVINLDDPIIICSGCFKNGNKCNRKAIMINKNIGYCKSHYKNIEDKKNFKELKKKKRKVDLLEIGKKLIIELDDHFKHIEDIDEILLENQPSLKNPTMKSIQMIIYSYFLINRYVPNLSNNISMISATQKNKFCNNYSKDNDNIIKPTTKSSYNNAKKLAILVTKDILNNNYNKNHIDFFEKHKKKDDLADSYLQGIQYLEKK